MLYELSTHDVRILRAACALAQCKAVETAEASECCANNRLFPEAERASAARLAKWYCNRKADFETVSKALGDGREITTLAQAKEALER